MVPFFLKEEDCVGAMNLEVLLDGDPLLMMFVRSSFFFGSSSLAVLLLLVSELAVGFLPFRRSLRLLPLQPL